MSAKIHETGFCPKHRKRVSFFVSRRSMLVAFEISIFDYIVLEFSVRLLGWCLDN